MSAVESSARPADSEELVLVLVVLLSGVPLPAPTRVASSSLGGVQGAGDRRAPARALGAAASGKATAAHDGRSRVARCSESAAAAAELAVVHGYASDTAALAPAARRPPLDVRRSVRSAADRRGDPRAGAAAGAREPALGLPADRGRAGAAGGATRGSWRRDSAPPASAGRLGASRERGLELLGCFFRSDDLLGLLCFSRARQPTRPPGRLHRARR